MKKQYATSKNNSFCVIKDHDKVLLQDLTKRIIEITKTMQLVNSTISKDTEGKHDALIGVLNELRTILDFFIVDKDLLRVVQKELRNLGFA